MSGRTGFGLVQGLGWVDARWFRWELAVCLGCVSLENWVGGWGAGRVTLRGEAAVSAPLEFVETGACGGTNFLVVVLLVLAYVVASDLGLALWRVTWLLVVKRTSPLVTLGTSLDTTVTASLLPVPPSLPKAGGWRGVLSRFALVTDADRCLMLCLLGRDGRCSWETLLVPC